MTLSGYNPLERITVGGVDIQPKGLVVVVGPNCSGKTQFLQDIRRTLWVSTDESVVRDDVATRLPLDADQFITDLQRERYVKSRPGAPDTVLDAYAPRRGLREGQGGSISINDLRLALSQYPRANPEQRKGMARTFFNPIGSMMLTCLFAAQRLDAFNETATFDTETSVPQNDLQFLYDNPEAQDLLAAETGTVFGNAPWVDNTRGDNKLRLKVSGRPELPPL